MVRPNINHLPTGHGRRPVCALEHPESPQPEPSVSPHPDDSPPQPSGSSLLQPKAKRRSSELASQPRAPSPEQPGASMGTTDSVSSRM